MIGASTAVQRVLDALEGVERKGNGWKARCPAHDDRHASLSIDEGRDGRVLVRCFVDCPFEKIAAAAGLQKADFFPPRTPNGRPNVPSVRVDMQVHPPPPTKGALAEGGGGPTSSPGALVQSNTPVVGPGLTLERYAGAKRLPVEFLRGLGLSDMYYQGRPAVRIPYRNADGSPGPTRFRLALDRGYSDDRFRWKSGDKPTLYGLDRLAAARAAGEVVAVEGESDCHTGWHLGLPVVGVPGANNWREVRDAGHFDGIPTIYVVREPDAGGEAMTRWVAASAIRERVRFVDLGAAKDLSGLYLTDPSAFRQRWAEALAASVAWTDLAEREQTRDAREQRALAVDLLRAPDLIERLRAMISANGYAGDPAPAVRVYVAMTSRLLGRPVNVAMVSASSAGKNATVNAARALMPEEAVYYVGAGSGRVLVYTDEDFQRRVVLVEEADSIPDDGSAASAVRQIAENNEMVYEVTERDDDTGKFTTRRIVKPGPTCLVTTSTKSVAHQLGTRMLEMPVPDDAEQTRAVLHAHSRAARKNGRPRVDVGPWIALQRYLALSPVREVDVPFADALADLVPNNTVRMRRDFRQLLTFVQAIALLHQEQRADLGDGWIEATLEDYAAARELLAPIFDAVAAEGATPVIRQTVDAVSPGEEVSEAEVARRLGLARSTVSWRIGKALAGGWLVNNEKREKHPARLARGAPLPEDASALPTRERLETALYECTSTFRVDRHPPPPFPEPAPEWVEEILAQEGAP